MVIATWRWYRAQHGVNQLTYKQASGMSLVNSLWNVRQYFATVQYYNTLFMPFLQRTKDSCCLTGAILRNSCVSTLEIVVMTMALRLLSGDAKKCYIN